MKRHILAWAASAALIGAAGAAPAMADSGGTQALGQSASNQQSASSDATSTQYNPTNQNISVRVLSPGNNGPVTQTNSSQALSAAGNKNDTDQTASQTQGGGGGTQAADQSAASKQKADADATSTQIKPTNENISVRVLSPGDDGSVRQTNASEAGALAGNKNETEQTADQSQGGGSGTQAAEQSAYNDQKASADAESKQIHPTNQNIGVRVLSPGDNGSVKQTNASGAVALAGNENETTQDASQQQGGHDMRPSKDSKDSCCKDHGSTGIQALGQSAVNKQDASADATSKQIHPSNVNAPVRVGSPGDNGSVEQSNVSFAGAAAGNSNETEQNASQDQGGGYPLLSKDSCRDHCYEGDSTAIQALGQQAYSDQKAESDATSKQDGASNVNAPVRTGSPGDDKGSVEQLNASGAESFAGNSNDTEQNAEQEQHGGGYGTAIQALGQDAVNKQRADSDATSEQYCPVNLNAPVSEGDGYDAKGHGYDAKDRKPEKKTGKGGSVKQANLSWAKSWAGNRNSLSQWGSQQQ